MKNNALRNLAVTAIFAAVSAVLMFIQIGLPILPSFLKFDFSDFPALIVSFAVSPWHGAAVCLLKNLLHLFTTSTAGVGELNNFVIAALFVFVAGLIYHRNKTRTTALVGSAVGALVSAVGSVFYNYFIGYPLFSAALGIPMAGIVGMYSVILPSADTLWEALLIFNLPLTLAKGLASMLITMLIYKRISPLLKGKTRK
ncbi:MAG: ECF transporter S component [Clostridia bacterium]|nr:ECF transporter S component [Clostridia bacterium]MBQ5820486.1 ECF transporter S component [Clostridia bacterium]